jgi:hypothetical protein
MLTFHRNRDRSHESQIIWGREKPAAQETPEIIGDFLKRTASSSFLRIAIGSELRLNRRGHDHRPGNAQLGTAKELTFLRVLPPRQPRQL